MVSSSTRESLERSRMEESMVEEGKEVARLERQGRLGRVREEEEEVE